MLNDPAIVATEDERMNLKRMVLALCVSFFMLPACSAAKYLRGGIHREMDENLTIVSLIENPNKYLNKELVFSVRFYKKGDLPCPLGDDYVNLIIADRVSYITLNKVWMRKEKAAILDELKEMETIVIKARVFKIDREKDPNLDATEIVRE
jgi:hypothetical protein